MTLKQRRGHPIDDSPLLGICYRRWNQMGMTWKEAVEEASLIFHLAVKIDKVRETDAARRIKEKK